MGTIKDRSGMDLTEAEDIKKRRGHSASVWRVLCSRARGRLGMVGRRADHARN